MNYKDLNDFEIIYNIRENSEEASEMLYQKYEPLIRASAKRLYRYSNGLGLELNDYIQEGMIALSSAIKSYDECQDASFYTYARVCIEKRMVSLMAKSTSAKNKILNTSLPFEILDDEGDVLRFQSALQDDSTNPEEIMISIESEKDLVNRIKQNLTDLESQLFDLKTSGLTYREIALILDKSTKSIDNAIQRIKTKFKDQINDK